MKWYRLQNISPSIISMRLAKRIGPIRCLSRKISFSLELNGLIVAFLDRSVYPTMEQLAETVNDVFNHLKSVILPSLHWLDPHLPFSIKTAIGFGIGVGANILTRFAVSIHLEVKISLRICRFLVAKSSKTLWLDLGQLHLAWPRMVRRFLAESKDRVHSTTDARCTSFALVANQGYASTDLDGSIADLSDLVPFGLRTIDCLVFRLEDVRFWWVGNANSTSRSRASPSTPPRRECQR